MTDHKVEPEVRAVAKGVTFKQEMNINTIITLLTFFSTVVAAVTVWNNLNFRVEANEKLVAEIRIRVQENENSIRSLRIVDAQMEARLKQTEEGIKEVLSRITGFTAESNRSFLDLRRDVNTLYTQAEVLRQILVRIEAQNSGRTGR